MVGDPDMATDSFYGEKESVARALGGWGELAKPVGPISLRGCLDHTNLRGPFG